MSNVLTGNAWKYHKSLIDETTGVVDIGIGADVLTKTGYPAEKLKEVICPMYEQFIDGGANIMKIDDCTVYVRRRNRCLDVGTRIDFQKIGWESLCDLLDEKYPT